MNLLEVKNISKTYGTGEATVHALKQATFSVPKGEFVAIVGESGSGKSTLLNMIGALDTPTSGKVFIDGKDIFSMKERNLTVFRRRNIGFIFQSFNLIPELTVEQNMIFPVLLDYQKPNKKYLEELLTVLGLKERRNHLPSQRRPAAARGDWPCADYPPGSDPGRRTHWQPGHPEYQRSDCPAERSLPAV